MPETRHQERLRQSPSLLSYTARIVKRPLFWIGLALLSVAAGLVAWRAFPQAFSILAIDISMDRSHALEAARQIAARDHLGPADYREAASFTLDDDTQTFVELEGGGKAVFTAMVRDGLYAAYTWRVRHFKEGEANETTIAFTPDGRAYGFAEKIKEDAPGPALEPGAAREIAERDARANWSIDFAQYALVEQGQERRTSGRVDHALTYERPSPILGEGRYRLRLVVSGDRLTEVTPFVKVPEAFERRYQTMRSANNAIGAGSVVAMILLYGVGGIGIGLFRMLRLRWVLWHQAVWWGAFISALQQLGTINEWPLIWMGYDTAVPRTVFFGQQVLSVAAGFLGFTAVYALSFMAAETLTRRAFGSHPQFWRVWTRGPGSSTAILGRTVGGYLLVSVFFAYDVVLYLVATRKFGWWAPAEALVQPDVLATYAPWLSAIANSAQAGFWEECLFRAVPLAGAALIGDRVGQRKLFLILGFVIQAIVFGSGHAPYPNQPAFARPVELIIPSIGFGLVYLYFGLLPGIILHFVFDTVWFALPIFVAHEPGIWMQRTMVIAVALVPLWIVMLRRVQAGRWTTLDETDRNRGWTPEDVVARAPEADVSVHRTIGRATQTAWFAVAAVALVVCTVFAIGAWRRTDPALTVTRSEAIDIARAALQSRGAVLPAGARFMATVDDGTGGEHEFVSETAGEERRKSLLGSYLPKPRWSIRVAGFEGDVAQRAEEWRVYVGEAREAWPVIHQLPESRAGASLSEDAARQVALGAIAARWHFDVARGDIREISATPQKRPARTDWTLTFVDQTVPKLPLGEPRINVEIAGDEVAGLTRYLFVPEDWTRSRSAQNAVSQILQVVSALIPIGLLIGAAVTGLLAWTRGRYAVGLFFAAGGQVVLATLATLVNSWPAVLANLSTDQPLQIQVGTAAAVAGVGALLSGALLGLASGALPGRIASSSSTGLPARQAAALGIAAGCIAAAVALIGAWLATPSWAVTRNLSPLDSTVPLLSMAVDGIGSLVGRIAVLTTTLAALHASNRAVARRMWVPAALFIVGFAIAGAPVGSHWSGWLAAAALIGAGLVIVSLGLLELDLTMIPVAFGAAAVLHDLVVAAARPFPGAWIGSLANALVIALLAAWWFVRLRADRAPLRPS